MSAPKLVLVALALVACDGEWCVAGNLGGLACEGDSLVHCGGGWGTLALRAERIDCRAEGKYCARYGPNAGSRYACEPSLGPCDPKRFVPYCASNPHDPSAGQLVVCQRGQQLQAGAHCDLAKR